MCIYFYLYTLTVILRCLTQKVGLLSSTHNNSKLNGKLFAFFVLIGFGQQPAITLLASAAVIRLDIHYPSFALVFCLAMLLSANLLPRNVNFTSLHGRNPPRCAISLTPYNPKPTNGFFYSVIPLEHSFSP